MTPEERINKLEYEIKEIKAKKKDNWDRVDIIGKWLIPIAIAFSTVWFNIAQKEKEADLKTFEVAIGVLQSPKSNESPYVKDWALETFQKITGKKFSEEAYGEVKRGQLPSTNIQLLQLPDSSQLRIPDSGQLRVFIFRLKGTSPNKSEQLKSVLIEKGYENVTVTTSEKSLNIYPSEPDVRFYYPADSLNAQSLSNYINTALGIPTKVNDRSQDPDARRHRVGELHVYIREK